MSSEFARTESQLYLDTEPFSGLGRKIMGVDEWFEAWGKALASQDFLALNSLLFIGLKLPGVRGTGESTRRMLTLYLQVADGHQREVNFAGGDFKEVTPLGELSERGMKQQLSDLAWRELCNRAFKLFRGEYDETKMEYRSAFSHPDLAAQYLRFIDPIRQSNHSSVYACYANVQGNADCNYHRKAFAFLKCFLWEAWDMYWARKDLEWFKEESQKEAKAKTQMQLRYFACLKPQLARLMVYYGLEGFLFDKPLNLRTRMALAEMVLRDSQPREYVDIAGKSWPEVYLTLAARDSELLGKTGSPTLSHRDVVRILLLYPVTSCRRMNFKTALQKERSGKRAEKLAELEKKRAELERQIKGL